VAAACESLDLGQGRSVPLDVLLPLTEELRTDLSLMRYVDTGAKFGAIRLPWKFKARGGAPLYLGAYRCNRV
jgi:hypothetical protein